MPVQKPIRAVDGTLLHEILVPKGTLILPSLCDCSIAKDIWGVDASQWRPQRWLEPLPASVIDAKLPAVSPNLQVARYIRGSKLAPVDGPFF